MIYGSENKPVKTKDTQHLHRNEMIMVCLMCGVSRSDTLTCKELWATLGIDSITNVMHRERLRWPGHTERKYEENMEHRVENQTEGEFFSKAADRVKGSARVGGIWGGQRPPQSWKSFQIYVLRRHISGTRM